MQSESSIELELVLLAPSYDANTFYHDKPIAKYMHVDV